MFHITGTGFRVKSLNGRRIAIHGPATRPPQHKPELAWVADAVSTHKSGQ